MKKLLLVTLWISAVTQPVLAVYEDGTEPYRLYLKSLPSIDLGLDNKETRKIISKCAPREDMIRDLLFCTEAEGGKKVAYYALKPLPFRDLLAMLQEYPLWTMDVGGVPVTSIMYRINGNLLSYGEAPRNDMRSLYSEEVGFAGGGGGYRDRVGYLPFHSGYSTPSLSLGYPPLSSRSEKLERLLGKAPEPTEEFLEDVSGRPSFFSRFLNRF